MGFLVEDETGDMELKSNGSLLILFGLPQYSGVYVCRVHNAFTSDSASANVIARGKIERFYVYNLQQLKKNYSCYFFWISTYKINSRNPVTPTRRSVVHDAPQ